MFWPVGIAWYLVRCKCDVHIMECWIRSKVRVTNGELSIAIINSHIVDQDTAIIVDCSNLHILNLIAISGHNYLFQLINSYFNITWSHTIESHSFFSHIDLGWSRGLGHTEWTTSMNIAWLFLFMQQQEPCHQKTLVHDRLCLQVSCWLARFYTQQNVVT
jgi:hypothetical protein